MFTRMLSIMAKDARTGSRDQLVTYMMLAPVLLGLLLALILPILDGAGPRFAVVAEGLDPASLEALAEHGEVETMPDRAALEDRVRARDDAIGVIGRGPGQEPEVVMEGDEPEALAWLVPAILEGLAADPAAPGTSGDAPIAGALLAFCIVVIVGMMLGFTILEEKTSNTIACYRVSPLRFIEYLGAKLATALILSLVLVIPALILPLGVDLNWLAIEVMTVASLPFAVSLGLFVGAFAKDQLGAIAVLKALLPVWTSLPVLGFVLPDAWIWTQWPFANHWGVQGYYAALTGAPIWPCALAAFLAGLPILALAAVRLR
ncbi:MAG: ABC transporter permease [Myxococcales bacterium]|nr:ABC transporter permease [Myxococcales bacterium]